MNTSASTPSMRGQIRGGLMVSSEGIDGSGKSTHIPALADWMRGRGHEVIVTREPGGTALAEKLRELVLNDPMDPLTEALLVFAARRDHLRQVIEPALARNAIVLTDRFTDSSFAYQGHGRGFDLGVLGSLESWVQAGRQPDVTLWFDVPAKVAAQRRSAVRAPDRFEQEDTVFFQRVREGYLRRVNADPARFERIDAEQTREQVWENIMRVMSVRLAQYEGSE